MSRITRNARRALTRNEIIESIVAKSANDEGELLDFADVRFVLEALEELAVEQIGLGSPFTVPGIARITLRASEARPRRKGINPFTKEEQWFKAKPAAIVLKARPVTTLAAAAPSAKSAIGVKVLRAARSRSTSRAR
jgi:hypothetical protein